MNPFRVAEENSPRLQSFIREFLQIFLQDFPEEILKEVVKKFSKEHQVELLRHVLQRFSAPGIPAIPMITPRIFSEFIQVFLRIPSRDFFMNSSKNYFMIAFTHSSMGFSVMCLEIFSLIPSGISPIITLEIFTELLEEFMKELLKEFLKKLLDELLNSWRSS